MLTLKISNTVPKDLSTDILAIEMLLFAKDEELLKNTYLNILK